MHGDVLKVLLSEQEIAEKVAEMGRNISEDYRGMTPVVVSVLKGSFVFMADLIRAIDVQTEVDFMVVSSYGGVVSSGAVKIMKDMYIPIEGRDVLVVEDILDSGLTLEYLTEILLGRDPASLRIATLLDKPTRRKANITPDYVGFVIPDEFVIGYGLDYNEHYRNIPYIGVLKPDVYAQQDAEMVNEQQHEQQ